MNKILLLISLSLILSTNFCYATCSENQTDINSASAEELDQLAGIGPVKAAAIIDSRPFDSVNDLINVSGIGEITLQKIKDQGLACVSRDAANNNEDNSNDKENNEKDSETSIQDKINDNNKTNNESKVQEVKILQEKNKSQTKKIELEAISLSPQDIKSEDNKSELDKNRITSFGLVTFFLFLLFLFLIKRRYTRKDELQ